MSAHEYEGHYSCLAHKRVRCCPREVGKAETRQLYAIAFMWRAFKDPRKVWKRDIEYMHATDARDAEWWFFQSESPDILRRIHLVGIAPVIGYFAEDDNADVVSV